MDRSILSLCVALGIGLAIGLERQRSQAGSDTDLPAGLRTHAIVALSGAVAAILPYPWMLPALVAGTAALALAGYWRGAGNDPGLTSEFALVLTVLLGALAVSAIELAAGIATVAVVLLHAKRAMHRVVRETLSDEDVNDVLLLCTAALVIWPLLPDRYLGPFDAWNPHKLWLVVLIVMTTGAAGRAGSRLFGARIGLPVVGFFGGFASSLATTGAMAVVAGKEAGQARAALAAALLSSVTTFIQMMLVLAATSVPTLRALALPLAAGMLATLVSAGYWLWRCLEEAPSASAGAPPPKLFDWRAAVVFAVLVAALQLVGAALGAWLGTGGLIAISAAVGVADAHAVGTSVASLVATGKVQAHTAALPILAGLSTNTMGKIVAARAGGSRWFAMRIGIALVVSLTAAWATALALRSWS